MKNNANSSYSGQLKLVVVFIFVLTVGALIGTFRVTGHQPASQKQVEEAVAATPTSNTLVTEQDATSSSPVVSETESDLNRFGLSLSNSVKVGIKSK